MSQRGLFFNGFVFVGFRLFFVCSYYCDVGYGFLWNQMCEDEDMFVIFVTSVCDFRRLNSTLNLSTGFGSHSKLFSKNCILELTKITVSVTNYCSLSALVTLIFVYNIVRAVNNMCLCASLHGLFSASASQNFYLSASRRDYIEQKVAGGRLNDIFVGNDNDKRWRTDKLIPARSQVT